MTKLTQREGSYVNRLNKNKAYIERLYQNVEVDPDHFRSLIHQIVITDEMDNTIPENKLTAATKRFLVALSKQRNKMMMLQLVWNSCLNGDGFGVI